MGLNRAWADRFAWCYGRRLAVSNCASRLVVYGVASGRREGLWARFFLVAKTRNISGESVSGSEMSVSVSGPVRSSGLDTPTT